MRGGCEDVKDKEEVTDTVETETADESEEEKEEPSEDGAVAVEEEGISSDSPDSERYKHIPFRSPAALEIFRYGRELAAQRRGGTGTDLVSKLVNTVPRDGVPLTPTDFDNYFLLLVVAGNETTRHAISHSMLALINNPDQMALLQAQPELIPVAVEEFLRWASPVYHFRRTATRDRKDGVCGT